ncbi:hypothetical protein HMPREF3177_04105 [Nosocomiicoccus sp. HMSC09A07]|nr:hypothetical protein HMPREF3177_04105 [Nosocomiicoccus sp. HMSC09A07]
MTNSQKTILINVMWMVFIVFLIFMWNFRRGTIIPYWLLIFPAVLFSFIFIKDKKIDRFM